MRMSDQSDKPHMADAAALAQDLRGIMSKLKRRLREQANVGDLTPTQISVLLRLDKDGPATTSNLARAEVMRPQSMGAVVSALEAAGLVDGVPDPADGRQTILSLTDTCLRLIREGRAARQDWLHRKIEARLSLEEQEQLRTSLDLLRRLVDD
ncbi:MarR family transcriptional regulator [Rhizobium lusitanum]|nr:MarR family transcriptional regulator [Rhizobium lusitanum]